MSVEAEAAKGAPRRLTPSAVGDFEARIEQSLLSLSSDIRELQRNSDQAPVATKESSATAVNTRPAGSAVTLPVILLCLLITVLIGGLGVVMHESHTDFGKGIAIAEEGFRAGQNPSAMTRRIFLLACGNQIVTFKAAAFVISALMFFVGAVFVLLKADAQYALSTEGNGLKASLSTSSPGLVIVTLSVALAIATLYAKSSVVDQPDDDLTTPSASASSKQPAPPNPEDDLHRAVEEYNRNRVAAPSDEKPKDQQAKP